jgi:hypothetical protein
VSRSPEELVLRADSGEIAVVRPRYVGSFLGRDDGNGHTICNFGWDGEPCVGYAAFDEDENGDITIVPHDGTWVPDYEHVPRRP